MTEFVGSPSKLVPHDWKNHRILSVLTLTTSLRGDRARLIIRGVEEIPWEKLRPVNNIVVHRVLQEFMGVLYSGEWVRNLLPSLSYHFKEQLAK